MPGRAPGSISGLICAILCCAMPGPFGLLWGIIAIVALLRARAGARAAPERYRFGAVAWLAAALTAVGLALSLAITAFLTVFAAFLFALVAALAGYAELSPMPLM